MNLFETGYRYVRGGLLVGLLVWGSAAPPSTRAGEPDALAPTREALRKELTGDNAGRLAALQKINSQATAPPLSQWSLGAVQLGKEWLPYSQFIEKSGRQQQLEQYRQERGARTGTFADHVYLADLCRSLSLPDEEQAHLLQALLKNWRAADLHTRLGHVNFGGFWYSPEELQAAAERRASEQQRLVEWTPAVEKLVNAWRSANSPAARERALAKLRDIKSPDAIPAMEAQLARRSSAEAGLLIDWLSGLQSCEASAAIARVAVLADQPEVRVAAQRELRDRRLEEFVPWLLSGLETVQVSAFDIRIDPGAVTRLRVVRNVVVEGESHELTVAQGSDILTTRLGSGVQVTNAGAVNATLRMRRGNGVNPYNDLSRVLSALSREQEANVWLENSQDLRTERISRTLASATSLEGMNSAEDWWGWWRTVNDAERTGGKLKIEDNFESDYFAYGGYATPVPPIQRISYFVSTSCFSGDTLVQTESGPRRIDSIRVGDRVLSQNELTGELGFKAVWQTTVRSEAQLLKIRVAGETITCSIGHPFWVSGLGWRMARELHPGMTLHILDGGMRIESIEPAGTGSVHNLIVADTHTYFAGESKFYTHDVSPRTASDMILPGVRKEF